MSSLGRSYFSPSANQKATVGDTKFSVVNQDHIGWLKCDGRSLNVKDFYFLWSVIGYNFGGSGTTFQLPNAAGRVPGAVGTGEDLTPRHLGDLSGAEMHTLTTPEMPSHTHSGHTDPSESNISIQQGGSHSHNLVTQNDDFNFSSGNWPANTSPQSGMFSAAQQKDSGSMTWTGGTAASGNHGHAITDLRHNHTFTTGSTGGDQPHNNIQPTIFIGNMFIFSGKITYGSYPYKTNSNIY